MKLSELVRSAQYVLDTKGDCEVLIHRSEYGGYEILEVHSAEPSVMCLGEEENVSLSAEDILIYLPDYNGTAESLDEAFNYFEIEAGNAILYT